MCIEGSHVRVDKVDSAKTGALQWAERPRANIIGFDSLANAFVRVKGELRKYNSLEKAEKDLCGSVGIPLCRRSVCVPTYLPTTCASQNLARYIKNFEQIKAGRQYASSYTHSHQAVNNG